MSYDQLFYLGSTPMFLSFFIVALLTHWDNWDPIGDACLAACRRCSRSRRRRQSSSDDDDAAAAGSSDGSLLAPTLRRSATEGGVGDDGDVQEEECESLIAAEVTSLEVMSSEVTSSEVAFTTHA